jgi:hypothetical protein
MPRALQEVELAAVRPASSDRSEPSTSYPRALTIRASGNIPLPPMPQKK